MPLGRRSCEGTRGEGSGRLIRMDCAAGGTWGAVRCRKKGEDWQERFFNNSE
jgi:hypothetical protein